MARPHAYRTEAVVLRQRPLGDADKICVLLTPLRGRIEAVAKGVRRPKSRLAGPLQPLTRSTLLLAVGRSLDIITQAQTLDAYPTLHDEIDRLSRALYVAELVDRATGPGPHGGSLYGLLQDTLGRVDADQSIDLPVRWFEMRLLADQGYQPELGRCVHCQAALRPDGNGFSGVAGGVLCPACRSAVSGRPLSSRAFKLLRCLQSAPYEEAARVRVDAALARELEAHLLDAVQAALDQEFKAVKFIDAVRAIGGSAPTAPLPGE